MPSDKKKTKKKTEFIARLDLVDKFRDEHEKQIKWSGGKDTMQTCIFGRKVHLWILGLSFHSIVVYSDHRLAEVRMNFDSRNPKIVCYLKFNTSLRDVKDFWDQLLLTIKLELSWLGLGISGGINLKYHYFFATD